MSNFQGFEKVNIKRMILTSVSSRRGIDISPIARNIEIYCSIFSPVISGQIKINDATGSIQNLPVLGEEILELTFQTPGREEFSKSFFVYSLKDQEYNDNGALVSFTANFATIDHYKGSAISLNKGAKTNISDFVKDILTNDLGTSNEMNIEPTNGLERIVIPNWSIWETIEYLRQRAVSTEYSSPFLFFEDQKGYNFLTYEKLIEQREKLAEELVFMNESYKPGAGDNRGRVTVLPEHYRNVSQFGIITKTNTVQKVNEGGISSETILYDPFNKKTKVNTYNYSNLKDIVKKPLAKKFYSEHSSDFTKIMPTPTIKRVVAIDMEDKNYLSQDIIGAKQLFINALRGMCIGFTTNGDSQLQPGDIIMFLGPTRANSPEPDKQVTGKYIIGSLRHGILDGAMYTTVEAYRFGFNEEIIPEPASETEVLQPFTPVELQEISVPTLNIQDVNSRIENVGGDINSLGSTVGAIRGNINSISSNINQQVSALKDRIGPVITNVRNIQANVMDQYSTIQAQVSNIKYGVESIQNGGGAAALQSVLGLLPTNNNLMVHVGNIQALSSLIQNGRNASIDELQYAFGIINSELQAIQDNTGDYTPEIVRINEQITSLHGMTEKLSSYHRQYQDNKNKITGILDRI